MQADTNFWKQKLYVLFVFTQEVSLMTRVSGRGNSGCRESRGSWSGVCFHRKRNKINPCVSVGMEWAHYSADTEIVSAAGASVMRSSPGSDHGGCHQDTEVV